MRKSIPDILRYLFVPNTRLLGYTNVRRDFIDRPIPSCKALPGSDASGFVVIKQRRCRKGGRWQARYCVLYKTEIFLYKDKTGRTHDRETCRINLSRVLEFTISSNVALRPPPTPVPATIEQKKKPARPSPSKKTTEPLCVMRIVDERKRKYIVGLLEKDAMYWTSNFFGALLQKPQPIVCPKDKDAGKYRCTVLRTTVEQKRTIVLRSTMVVERDLTGPSGEKVVHQRHWSGTTTTSVDDDLLEPEPIITDLKCLTPDTLRNILNPRKMAAKKFPNRPLPMIGPVARPPPPSSSYISTKIGPVIPMK